MKTALIGYTGFVGSNLLLQGNFSETYNSSNISDICGKEFDTVWCAGIRAVKWWANQHPEEDWQSIEPLLAALRSVSCRKFILISTVDVFLDPSQKNENSPVVTDGLHPYGLHRLRVEEAIQSYFNNTTVVRLPGLFGSGLKKNIIYDFLHNNQTEKIHSDAQFQFYDLSTIYRDCCTAVNANLKLVHFAVAPVRVEEVARIILGHPFENRPPNVLPAMYDFQTINAHIWGAQGGYLQDHHEVLERLERFIKKVREEI